ncbi:MAG TPA: M28 family peptidase [Nocardioides sp.]|uniref:M28 family peptidase n=1 Tax=Nocardioides sp. TaxID=35761 RepID=UPI002D054861|nr:M28 family peptidase [Nocardioides sp.]HQR26094.1 M28 family peptidase [Nocardioides sp.]
MRSADLLATIQDLVALAPRATGTPGGEAAADYVAGRFRAAGLSDVGFLEVPSYSWRATRWRLGAGGQDLPCAPVLHSALTDHHTTGPLGGRVRAPVVDIGEGTVEKHDVRGRIVLFDLAFQMSLYSLLPISEYIHDPGRRLLRHEVLRSRNPYITSLTTVMSAAAEAGAVGVVGVLRDYPESLHYHNEYYRRSVLPLPGVWVTRSTGRTLRGLLRQDPVAELELAVERERVASRTVLGVLPGRTRETVMVQSHHDSVGPGAVEDASGSAEVIALAEHYGRLAAQGATREKTLLFVTFDTHFTGYQAHQEFARRYALDPGSPYDLVLNATVEHVGLRAVRGTDGAFASTGETEPRGLFENLNPRLKWELVRAIRRHGLHGTCLLNASLLEYSRSGIPTDASFMLLSGVPTVSLISGPLYLYDDADTPAFVDTDQLVPVARFFIDLIDRADRARGDRIGLVPRSLRRRLPRGRW